MRVVKKSSPKVRVVAFGDSTTAPREGVDIYAHQLAHRMPDLEIINCGVRGDSTEMASLRYQADVLDQKPDIVIIQFGINDAAVDVWKTPPAESSRVSLDRYQENLQRFVEGVMDLRAVPILMTPNPLRWTPRTLARYGQPPYEPGERKGFTKIQSDYATRVREIARALQVLLVDVEAAYDDYEANGGEAEDLLLDGMHPNTQGHLLVTDLLQPVLERIVLAGASKSAVV